MVPADPKIPSEQAATELWEAPVEQVLALFAALVAQVGALHQAGRLHGAILPLGTPAGTSLPLTPSPAAEFVVVGGSSEIENCPPELSAEKSWKLPCDLMRARQVLAAAGVDLDPRRVDLYHLGVLLCRRLTAHSTSEYLRSPRVRGQVPADLRLLIDHMLGHDASTRLISCEPLSTLLADVAVTRRPTPRADTPARGSAHTPVTMLAASSVPSSDGPLAAELLEPLTRLGAYRIVERIGAGGMGDVYKAHDESLDRMVAIKVLPPELARHADFVKRFRAEAMAIAKLTHPNIVQVYAFGEEGGRHYFAMQFVDGESLSDLLERRGRLPLKDALPIFEQCLAGLAAAHQRQLIHRDIKPGNILIDRQHNRALVADFGLVKSFDSGSRLTASGVIMGTVDYISPEQARSQPVDGRSDLYSLGALMYQTLSGRLPFESDSATGLMFQHAYEQPRPLGDLAPDVPQQVLAIILRLMAKDPAQRYAKAEDVLADIAAFLAGKPPASSIGGQCKSRVVVSAGDLEHGLSALDYPPHTSGDWRDQLWSWWQAFAPRAAQRLASTQHQVDGAVAEYEARRGELANVIRAAEAVAAEFAVQAASHREAATAAVLRAQSAGVSQAAAAAAEHDRAHFEQVAIEFESQLIEQQEQLEALRLRLTQVDATLVQLRSQRDVLQSRLRAAQARLALEGSGARRRPRWPTIVVAGAAATLALVGLAMLLRPAPPSTVIGNPLFRDAVLVATFDPSSQVRQAGEIVVRDLSDKQPPGTLRGAKLVEGKAGLGVALENEGDHIDFGTAIKSPLQTLAVCAWIKPSPRIGHCAEIVSEYSEVGGARGFALRLYTKRPHLTVGDTYWTWLGDTRQVPMDRWTHVAAVRGIEQSKLYINGKVVAIGDSAKPILPSAAPLRIGNAAMLAGRQFYGVIDEVAVFERPLSDADVQRIYQLGEAGLSLNAPATAVPSAAIPRPESHDSDSPVPGGGGPVTAEKIVIWNMHNGTWADRGTTVCHVELRRGGSVVWSKRDVKVNWSNAEDPATEIPLPNIPFDTVRLDLVAWMQWGAGLSEVEVIKDGRNIALDKPVKVNGERAPFTGARVTDGVKSSSNSDIGYWWAPDHQPAWIEIAFALPDEVASATSPKESDEAVAEVIYGREKAASEPRVIALASTTVPPR